MRAVATTWPGGVHQTMLALSQLEGLQQATDAGPEFLFNKFRLGHWAASDAFEVIRWGLIGGGMDAAAAQKATRLALDRSPLAEFKPVCIKILADALYGPADDPVGEDRPVASPALG